MPLSALNMFNVKVMETDGSEIKYRFKNIILMCFHSIFNIVLVC